MLEDILRQRDTDKQLHRGLGLKSLEVGLKMRLLETDVGGKTLEARTEKNVNPNEIDAAVYMRTSSTYPVNITTLSRNVRRVCTSILNMNVSYIKMHSGLCFPSHTHSSTRYHLCLNFASSLHDVTQIRGHLCSGHASPLPPPPLRCMPPFLSREKSSVLSFPRGLGGSQEALTRANPYWGRQLLKVKQRTAVILSDTRTMDV